MPNTDVTQQTMCAAIRRIPITIPASSGTAATLSALVQPGSGAALSDTELARLMSCRIVDAGDSFEVDDVVGMDSGGKETYTTADNYDEPITKAAADGEYLKASADATVSAVARCYISREPILVE